MFEFLKILIRTGNFFSLALNTVSVYILIMIFCTNADWICQHYGEVRKKWLKWCLDIWSECVYSCSMVCVRCHFSDNVPCLRRRFWLTYCWLWCHGMNQKLVSLISHAARYICLPDDRLDAFLGTETDIEYIMRMYSMTPRCISLAGIVSWWSDADCHWYALVIGTYRQIPWQ